MLRWCIVSFACCHFFLNLAYAQKEFGFDNRKASGQPYLKPEETVTRMQIVDGFEVKLFAAEPQLVNPIAMTVDEKGRVWVVECFEYPKRTPKGKMPRDRIKILEDTDGDGVCDRVKIFAEGKDFPAPFDLASGIEVGNGGVYLGAPPYLWFLKDINGDDKADQFEILLKGFGSQDTHETLNTFQWGPDGRLYGLHGVFTYSEVKPGQADGPSMRMNAAVWRYDTRNKSFETFAEGTSNPWGMDWRNSDGQFILCCCVIPHLFHMSPGGIYKRQAGQSFNPYAYGYLNEICDHTFHKESGWAHAGLISLDTPLMPEEYRNRVIFGSIHGCAIKQNELKKNGSTYRASRVDNFMTSGDKNFRPINLRWGPNGEIYCIDWHDQSPCHQAAPESWDYERGRVYRFQTKGLKTQKPEDLSKKSSDELKKLVQTHPNPYVQRTALRLLSERSAEQKKKPDLSNTRNVWIARVEQKDQFSVDAAIETLKAEKIDSTTRGWLYRYIGEVNKLSVEQVNQLASLSKEEKEPAVRLEIASTAIRQSKSTNIQVLIRALLTNKQDAKDPVLPNMIWLAYESKVLSSLQSELDWLKENAVGNDLIRDTIVPRTMQRLVATGNKESLEAAVVFLKNVNDSGVRAQGLQGLIVAFGDRLIDAPSNWNQVREELSKDTDVNVQKRLARLSVNFRDPIAMQKAIRIIQDASASVTDKQNAIRDLAVGHPDEGRKPLQDLIRSNSATELRVEAVRALAGYAVPEIAKELLADWAKYPQPVRSELVSLLAGRKEWAKELLIKIGENKVQRTELTDNIVLRIQGFKDNQLTNLIEKTWGRVRPSPAELTALIDKMRNELNTGKASFAKGKLVFEQQCAKCHKFDGGGYEVGPNIEGAGRDVEYLLVNILDPNRVIGAPYFMRTINLASGLAVQGVLVAEDDQSITLKTENAVLKVISKKDIEESRVQEKSLMPEGLANNMTVQDFRDLVRYLMANPYLTDVQVSWKQGSENKTVVPVVPPSGEIRLTANKDVQEYRIDTEVTAPADGNMSFLVDAPRGVKVLVNEALLPTNAKGDSNQVFRVNLKKGTNKIALLVPGNMVSNPIRMRFHDPDRKLMYPDLVAPKK